MKRFLLAATLASAIAGCVQFAAKPLDASRSAARLSGHRLAAKTWTLFALIDEAVRNHPEVALARAQYATAKAAIRSAGERPNPTLLLSPQIVTPIDWIAGTYGVEFDWTFETAGKRAKRGDVANANVNAAANRVVDAIWKVRASVRKAMLDLYGAERRASLVAAAIAKQEELLKLIDARVKAGAVSHIEMAQPRLMLVQLRMQQADAGKAAALGRASLAEALGMGTAGLGDARFSFAAYESTRGLSSSHRRAALTHRADVLAALADYAAAEAVLRLEIAKQYPDIHLNPGYQLDGGANKWGLGLGITLPILNQNQGAIGEAEAKRKEAAAKFNVVQTKVLADCDRAAASVGAARVKLSTAANLIAEQQRQFETEKRIVAAGEGDKLTLLTAEVERAATEITRLDAAIELQAALGALEEATQTLREKMKKLLNILITFALLAVLGWVLWRGFTLHREKADEAKAEHEKEEAEKKTAGEPEAFVVKLEKEKWKALGLEMSEPEKAELKPQRVAFGRVMDPVPLVTLDGDLAAAEAALAASRAEYERTQALQKAGEGISRKVAETAEAQFRADEIKADGLRRRARLEWGAAFSTLQPAERRSLVEQFVRGDSALVRVELLPGDALAELPALARLSVLGREAEMISTKNISPATDTDAKTQAQGFVLRVEKPAFALRPGMALSAWLELAQEPRKGFALPRSSVLRHDGATWIFVQEETEKFVRKPVTLVAPLDGEKGWFVAEDGGIRADDLIVETGAQALLSEELKAQGGGEKD